MLQYITYRDIFLYHKGPVIIYDLGCGGSSFLRPTQHRAKSFWCLLWTSKYFLHFWLLIPAINNARSLRLNIFSPIFQREPPDLCVLLGPIVDVKNPEIEKGSLDVTYDELFRRTIEQITNATAKYEFLKTFFTPKGQGCWLKTSATFYNTNQLLSGQ